VNEEGSRLDMDESLRMR